MKKMKALFCALTVFAACAAPAAAKNRLEKILEAGKIVHVCEPAFAPYEFIDTSKTGYDQYRGADIKLGRYIADRLGVKHEIVPLGWSAVLAAMAAGKYDMCISGLSYTEERSRSMLLSDIYKQGGQQGFLIRVEDDGKYTSMDSFAGKKVGYHSGTLQEQLCQAQLKDKNCTFRVYDTVQNAVLALASGKIDAVAASWNNAAMFVSANPKLMILPNVTFRRDKSGNCVAVPRGETELIAKINEILAEVKAKDLYMQWTREAEAEAKALGLNKK